MRGPAPYILGNPLPCALLCRCAKVCVPVIYFSLKALIGPHPLPPNCLRLERNRVTTYSSGLHAWLFLGESTSVRFHRWQTWDSFLFQAARSDNIFWQDIPGTNRADSTWRCCVTVVPLRSSYNPSKVACMPVLVISGRWWQETIDHSLT